jgi:hypothetical protein
VGELRFLPLLQIIGAGGRARAWYVNFNWPGCSNDLGWMMVTHNNACTWEGRSVDAPSEILYSPGSTVSSVQNTFLLVFGR